MDGERGVVVNTASIAALDGSPGQGPYATTKAGLIALALPLARELAGRGIRTNTVTPGGFDTPMNAWIPQEFVDSVSTRILNPQRLGQAGEYAEMALALGAANSTALSDFRWWRSAASPDPCDRPALAAPTLTVAEGRPTIVCIIAYIYEYVQSIGSNMEDHPWTE
jgi:NAD(P)-dependent dehydrogenase (short-subunit alcohol dehydrogenase family)